MPTLPLASPRASRLAGAIALVAAGQAQGNDTLNLDATVVTAAGYEQKVTEAPASISVLTREELEQKRYGNLAEALEDVEGVDIGQGTGKTGGLNISIRGLPSDYTLVLIDGRRQNSAGNVTPNGFGETATSFMPPLAAIERIEVIRGPMSTLYGSDAMGGVVNIITRKVAREWGGSLSLEHTAQQHRDFGASSGTSLYASGPLVADRLGLNLRGSFFDRGASDLRFDDGNPASRRGLSPVEGRNYTIGSRLSLSANADHDFSLDFERGRQRYANDDCQLGTLDGKAGGSATDGCSRDDPRRANGYADELRFERDQFALGHTARLGFGNLESSLTHNRTETLGRTIPGTVGRPYSGYPSVIGGDQRLLRSTDLVLDSKLVSPLGDAHVLSLGGQYWDARVEDGIVTEDFRQSSWALFAEDEWRLREDLALTLGGRYEDHEAFGGHFSPRAYLVWNGSPGWTLKGGVSQGYKTPSVNQLHAGINGVSGQGQILTLGSPDLGPETSTSTELGLYYDNLADFNTNLTLFHTRFKDRIDTGTPLPNCNWPDAPGQPGCVDLGNGFQQESFAQQVNIGRALTRGVELAGRWQFAPAWSMALNYTYTDSEQRSGIDKGAPLTNTPLHMANARLDWTANERLRLWLKSEYRGERARFASRYANLSAANQAIAEQVGDLEAYALFHLGGSFKAADNLTFNATLYNLFDKDFLDGRYYTTSSGASGWASDFTQSGSSTAGTLEEGRRLWLSAVFEF